ncbi:MAG: type II toxin-antitoxin system MqsA family antitoxin [Bacteroidota bacterium]
MKCAICKTGETKKGFTTVTLERNQSVIVFKEVPAQICDNCGEYYLDEAISSQLIMQAENAVKTGAEVEVIRLRKAS